MGVQARLPRPGHEASGTGEVRHYGFPGGALGFPVVGFAVGFPGGAVGL
ncbi:MAG TPA: hypothetical protein VGK18_14930 [Propionicimonas sp.]